MPRIGRVAFSMFLASFLLACGRADSPGTRALSSAAEPSGAPGSAPAAELASLPAPLPAKRIQTGALSVEVEELAEAERTIAHAVEALGGYVQDRSASGQGEQRTSSLVLRVPAERFEDAVAAAEALGEVHALTTETEDVSEAYLDLETRLRVKRGVEARLRGILDVRAGKLSEVLEVETQLARVVEEVERIQGALRAYDQRTAWSTVRLQLRQRPAIVRAGFRDRIGDAFREGMAAFTAAVTGVLSLLTFLLPWLAIGAIVLWGMLRFRRRPAT